MQLLDEAGHFKSDGETPGWVENLRVDDLSLGTYSLPAGCIDDQEPHNEDEVYVVLRGRGRFTGGGETVDVGAGSVIFVPANEDHQFHDITEDLVTIVVFAPAEGSRDSAG